MKIFFRSIIIVVFAITYTVYFTGCSNTSNTNSPVNNTAQYSRMLERAKKNKRHLIMYSGVDTYSVRSMVVERSKQQFTVHLNKLDSLHRVNINAAGPLGDKHLHIYMKDSTSYTLDEPHTIPLIKIATVHSAE